MELLSLPPLRILRRLRWHFPHRKQVHVRITIDSKDSIEQALAVVGALYGVHVAVSDSPDAAPEGEAGSLSNGATSTRKASKRATARAGRSRRGTGRRAPQVDLAAVRAWAREHGYEVSNRGRLPQAVINAYTESTQDNG